MNSVLESIVGSHRLNPTSTVVRSMPIIADAWEDAAVQQNNDIEDEVRNNEPPAEIQTNFMKDLLNAREQLKPTLTEIKCGIKPESGGDSDDESGNSEDRMYIGPTAPSTQYTPPLKSSQQHLEPDYGWSEAHGFRGSENWELPVKVKHCEEEARPGYATKLAHEYNDTPEVLQEKVRLLAQLLRASEHCLLYTGAGISTASGIGDYATRAGSSCAGRDGFIRPKIRSPYEAQPTYAHRAFVALHEAQLIKYWVQQNHDGLPQKAGLPQHAINEIHGAWYDPSNPVVAMSGSLRADLFKDLLAHEQKTDLTLAVGTSMCGMNVDRVFTTVANKGRQAVTGGKKQYAKSLGGVIINRQQTQFDHLSCLRIYADIDEVMAMLLEVMEMLDERAKIAAVMASSNISAHFLKVDTQAGQTDTVDVFRIPYDQNGHLVERCPKHSSGTSSDDALSCTCDRYTLLDMRVGSEVQLTGGPYEGDRGVVLGTNREGHYRVQFRHLVGNTRRPFESVLGSWWLQSAVRGDVTQLPVVSVTSTEV